MHLEFWKDSGPKPDFSVCKPDLVVLAGDIAKGTKAVKWAAISFAGLPVLYVHGNHEAYSENLDRVQIKIAEACEGTNVHFLNCDAFYFDDVMFIGATLWTDFELYGQDRRNASMEIAKNRINDYRLIRLASNDYKKLTPLDTLGFHKQHKEFIEHHLSIDSPQHRKTVVITHMAPSILSVPKEYKGDILNPYYASNLDSLVAMADLWIHGHTHTSFDYKIGKCRVVCNPRGYPNQDGAPENFNFKPNFIVEI
jgi:predicted phosphodiesterase